MTPSNSMLTLLGVIIYECQNFTKAVYKQTFGFILLLIKFKQEFDIETLGSWKNLVQNSGYKICTIYLGCEITR